MGPDKEYGCGEYVSISNSNNDEFYKEETPFFGEEFPFDEMDRAIHRGLQDNLRFQVKQKSIRFPVKHKKPHMNRRIIS